MLYYEVQMLMGVRAKSGKNPRPAHNPFEESKFLEKKP
jgi:hypothetical protein